MSEQRSMPVRFFDAVGKVSQTVRLLAVLPDRLQERIVKAFISQWSRVKADDFPSGLREQYETLDRRMTAGPTTNEHNGLIQATVLRMSDDEARELAEAIVSFAYELRQESARYRYDKDLRDALDEELLSLIDATADSEPVN